MIGFVRGTLAFKEPPSLVIDVGGVGYEIEAPMSTIFRLPNIGTEVQLHTHLVVREDQQTLFGFSTDEERRRQVTPRRPQPDRFHAAVDFRQLRERVSSSRFARQRHALCLPHEGRRRLPA